MAYVILDKMTNCFLGPSGEFVYHSTDAKTFSTKEAAEQYIDRHKFDYKGYDLKVVTESKQSKFSKSLKENLQGVKKIQESVQMNDSFNGGAYPIAKISAISERGSYGLNITMQANSSFEPKGTIVWNIGYQANGPYNPGATTYKHVEEEDAEVVMKKDYAEFKKVLKRCVEYCDREISTALNKMGYKE